LDNSFNLDDLFRVWESLPKIDKSELPKVLYVNKKTFPKMLDQLDVLHWSDDYCYFRGADVLIRETVPDNQIIMEMQDGIGKIFELE
jgi:hypothetical protein